MRRELAARSSWGLLVGLGLLLGAPRTAQALPECVIPKGSTTCTVERSSPGVIIPADRPLLNVKVNNLANSAFFDGRDCTALTYRLFIGGTLAYEASVLPGQDNFDGPGSSTAGDNVGRYPPGTYPYREVFEFRTQPSCPPGLQEYVGEASSGLFTFSGGDFEYHLNVSAIDLLQAGAPGSRRYFGNDWDPAGGPIKIFWGKTRIKTFPATSSFRGNLPAGFPDNSCTAKLTARQGSITRTIRTPHARKVEEVAFAEGSVQVRKGRDLQTGDIVCRGETVRVGDDGAFVGRALGGAPYTGLRVVNRQTDIEVPGGIYAPAVVVGLSGGRTVTVTGTVLDLPLFDPARGALNYNEYTGSLASLDVVGLARGNGDLTVNGALTGDNALLFVDGSLTVHGGTTGAGAVFIAADRMRLEGPIHTVSDVVDGVALGAGKKLLLLGAP